MDKTLIAAINLKGGSCKTSTIVNLGGVLHESGKKIVLIDLDPQQSASCWAKQGKDKFPFPVIALKISNAKQFKAKVDQLAKEYNADTILFDTPPQLENESLISALMSDLVIIPVTPSPLDIWAAEHAIAMIKNARNERKGLPITAIIPSRIIPNTVLAREIRGSLKQFNEPISSSISQRVAISEACIAGLPINLYAPNSPSHKEFKDIMKFILTNLRKEGKK